MKFKNKAQVEVQFNWMFVLLVGVVLLVFFITVVNRQKEASELTISADVLSKLENMINSVAVSEGKTFLIETPNVPFVYECDKETCACSIRVKARGATDINIKNNPVFAPNSIKGLKVLMWSQAFNIPFRATNFFYMTSPEVRYLIEDSYLGQFLYDSLPEKKIIEEGTDFPAFTKELFSDLNSIQNLNNYKVKFIFTDTMPANSKIPNSLLNMPDADVSAVKINENNREMEFYQKKGGSFELKGKAKYIESASLYGAIFSENIETYKCMMENAFKNANFVAQVYKERAKILKELYADNPECAVYYDTIYLEEIINLLSRGFDVDVTLLQDNIRLLKSQNEGALLSSCAAIY